MSKLRGRKLPIRRVAGPNSLIHLCFVAIGTEKERKCGPHSLTNRNRHQELELGRTINSHCHPSRAQAPLPRRLCAPAGVVARAVLRLYFSSCRPIIYSTAARSRVCRAFDLHLMAEITVGQLAR